MTDPTLAAARAALAGAARVAVFSGAGVSETRIHHLHGTIGKDRCNSGCGHEELVDLANPPPLRACPRCGAPLRPAVVWFGEPLPQIVWREAERTCGALDCLLVVGTSAVVYPAASLIELAATGGATIISANTEPSGSFAADHFELIGPASKVVPQLLEGMRLATR